MDMPDDLAVETSVYRSKRNYRTSSKHDFEGRRSDSFATHHGPRGRREKTEAWLHDCDNDNPKIARRNDYMSKPSHSILGPGKSLVTEERAPFTKTEKVPLFVCPSACILELFHAKIFSIISSYTLGMCRRKSFMEK
jgi:hypothetical protein